MLLIELIFRDSKLNLARIAHFNPITVDELITARKYFFLSFPLPNWYHFSLKEQFVHVRQLLCKCLSQLRSFRGLDQRTTVRPQMILYYL